MALATLDWLVLAAYVTVLVVIGVRAGRGQRDARDYFLAGRRMPAWAVALSILATQAGAVSLIGAPAFVALHPGGGLVWLQYELAVPVAMMFLMVTLAPALHRAGYVSVYEHLERRFDRRTRTAVSVAFQVSRALATGVGIYALAIVVATAFGWSLPVTIVAIGAVTILYDAVGGMRAVIASDVLQMGVIVAGLGAAIVAVLAAGGGADVLLAAADPARARTIDLAHHGFGDGHDFAFWPMLLGGFFLYVAYYGVDQSQAQRILSARSTDDARRALLLNGLMRFPLVAAYCVFGLLLAGLFASSPEFRALVPADRIDALVPTFIVHYLPPGVTGLLVAAILAAAMSSLDSAINSLSAATMSDVVEPHVAPGLDDAARLRWAKRMTVGWGVACTLFALLAAQTASSVLALINAIGSAFYGPVLAVFLLGFFSRRATAQGALAGFAAGLAVNFAMWRFAPDVSFLWWNPIGFGAAVAVGLVVSRAAAPLAAHRHLVWRTPAGGVALPSRFGAGYLALSVFFAVVLFATAGLARGLFW